MYNSVLYAISVIFNADFKSRMDYHKARLVQIIQPRCGLLEELRSVGILNVLQYDEMMKINSSASSINESLLKIITKIDEISQYELFMSALKKTHQMHVVNFMNSNGCKC